MLTASCDSTIALEASPDIMVLTSSTTSASTDASIQPNSTSVPRNLNFCNTCDVSFGNDGDKRTHAKSQWHVYNVKRRIAALGPISLQMYETQTPQEKRASAEWGSHDGEGSDESEDTGSESSELEEGGEVIQQFVSGQCLFCSSTYAELDDNLNHMHRAHGLFIPETQRLIVDLETLVRYLHLVIFGYNECISCGTVRSSPCAAQQHMIGKGHCRFDISNKESEFADFYESDSEDDGKTKKTIQLDSTSLRLSSGMVLSNRSSPQPRHHRSTARSTSGERETRLPASGGSHLLDGESLSHDEPEISNQGRQLTKKDRRNLAIANQLAHLSVNDRTSLMHLPAAEQRATLAVQKNQVDKARRAEQIYRSRVEGLGNKTLMKHFVADAPARKNG